MEGTVFINYVNGVHQNNWEQQRRILSHASRQKLVSKNAAAHGKKGRRPIKKDRLAGRAKVTPSTDEVVRIEADCSCENYMQLHAQLMLDPESDRTLNSTGLDPFGIFCVPQVAGVTELLGYILQSYAARIQPLQRALGCQAEVARHSFATAMANPEFMNALLAMGSGDYEARMRGSTVVKPSARVLYFRGQALKLLSQKLEAGEDAVDVGTVQSIVILMGMDISYGEAEPVLMHRRALRRILDMSPRPGRYEESPLIVEKDLPHRSQRKPGWWLKHPRLAHFTEDYLSDEPPSWYLAPGETLLTPYRRSRYRPLTYLEPFSSELYAMVSELPIGFQALALQSDISIEVLQIVRRMTKVVQVLEKARNRTAEPAEVDFAGAYKAEHEFHECIDCLRRISRSSTRDTAANEATSTTIEHVVCLALLMFINCVFGCMTYGPLFNMSRNSLSEALQNCQLGEEHEDCITWGQMVGVWADYIVSGPGAELPLSHIWTEYGASQSWEEIDSMLQRFLWTEDMAIACARVWGKSTSS